MRSPVEASLFVRSRFRGSSAWVRGPAVGAALAVAVVGAAHAQCAGDVDGDGEVRGADLAALLSDWGGAPSPKLSTDVTGDGFVDGADLAAMLANWGRCFTVPPWATLLEGAPDASVVTDAALRGAIEESGLAWRIRDNATGIEMLLVPSGSFAMGASAADVQPFSDEFPQHGVAISQAFYLGRYETTQEEFFSVLGYNPSFFSGVSDLPNATHPVESVSYFMALDFMSATGLRLPSEAEWEFACRAGTTTPTHAQPGQDLVSLAWYEPNSGYETHPVGQRVANQLGFHDMYGNVWEWCRDWYDPDYYEYSPTVDPQGPSAGMFRILRGGSWYAPTSNVRSAMRGVMYPEAQLGDTGFRVARNP